MLLYSGKVLPLKITGMGITGGTAVKRGDVLTLTCTFATIINCTQVYVYLCLNGTGNSKKQLNCSNMAISTSFHLSNVSEKNSGSYSCVYSVSDHSLSKVNNTGGNTIFVQVHGKMVPIITEIWITTERPLLWLIVWVLFSTEKDDFDVVSVISISVAALVVLLVLLGFCWHRDIHSFSE